LVSPNTHKRRARMLNGISRYYKESISSYGLVFRHLYVSYFFTTLSIISIPISGLLLIVGIIFSLIGLKVAPLFAVPFITSILITIITITSLNNKVKKFVRRNYNLKPKKGLWRTQEFDDMQYNLLVEYLNKNNLYTEDKIKLLIDLLNKETERNKLPPLVIPSVVITFSVPIWIQYVTFIYKSLKETEKLIASMTSFYLFALVLLCAFLIGGGKRIIEELRDNGITVVSLNKGLIKKLEEVLLRI
ncbi:hypothetical protein, partial [Paenibacillus sp. SI8]|uniref:hypothetical protein n=1 Tax=unclassified Paenibacillus TaxID=185978 RepID=UPI003466FCB1